MAKDEKAPAPAKAEAKPDAAAAAAEPKKKLPIKAAIIVLALLFMEGGGLYFVLSMTGKPRVSAAAEADGEAAGDSAEHAKKDGAESHGDAKKAEASHGEKKKDEAHGEKKREEAGKGEKKKEEAGGHGDKKKEEGGKGAAHDPVETVEILVAKDRFPNNHTGRTWLWDAEIHVQVKGKNADRINGILTGRAAEVKTGLAKIWRTAQHNHFNEPGLETLTRQVSEFLDSVLGTTADGKSFIDRVLIPRCVGYPTEY